MNKIKISNELNETISNLQKDNLIDGVEDKSDSHTNRLRLHFKNGYQLSVVIGELTYGGDDGLFEIAPFNSDNEMDGRLFDVDDQGDNVLGYLTIARVSYYINKVAHL